MSKAEERALEKYPILKTELGDLNSLPRIGFIEGYREAEKDNKLTLKDIKTIDKLLNQCVDYDNPYQEVLKIFNEYKQKMIN